MAEIKQSQQPITNPALVQAMDAMKQERNQKTEITFVNHVKAARLSKRQIRTCGLLSKSPNLSIKTLR